MANPYYVHPGGDFGPGLQGLAGQITKVGEIKRREAAVKKAAKRIAAARTASVEAFKTGDPNKIAETMLEYPEMSEALNQVMKFKNETTKESYVNSMFELLQNPERAEEIAAKRQTLLKEQGVSPEMSQDTDTFLERYRADPEGTLKNVEAELAFRVPKKYKAWKEAMGDAKSDDTANIKDFKHYQELKKVDPAAAKEFATQIKVRSWKTDEERDLDMQKIQGQIDAMADAAKDTPLKKLQREKLEVQIAEIKAERGDKLEEKDRILLKEKQKVDLIITGYDSAFEEMDRAIEKAKGSWTATGLTGAITGMVPGSPAYKLKGIVETVKANIGFDKLQAMRDASPTGGALGQVSEKELKYLQATIAKLDPAMGEEELVRGIEKVKRIYTEMKNKMRDYTPDEKIGDMSSGDLWKAAGGK